MKIDLATHLLTTARYIASPHCDDRPESTSIDMIVVHNISLPPRQFATGAVEKFFCGRLDFTEHSYFATIAELKVSAHLFIDRKGTITQFVPFNKRAWHAGQSFFQGRERCNDFSIGIELEGCDDLPYEDMQYLQLTKVVSILIEAYPAISSERIVGHSDIAPGRKTDPGSAFDWSYFGKLIKP